MCSGGRRLCDFVAGTTERPGRLPDPVERCLTETTDGHWIIWAYKVAFRAGDCFEALTGGRYPADSEARCQRDPRHVAPDAACTCGFHALSDPDIGMPLAVAPPRRSNRLGLSLLDRVLRRITFEVYQRRPVLLTVALSGRILAFEYIGDAVLFRAERQTVVRVYDPTAKPDEPRGIAARLTPRQPTDVGPVRLTLPDERPVTVALGDDAGFCLLSEPATVRRETRTLTATHA